MVEIDKGIAPPLEKSEDEYPFAAMEVGDSFHLEADFDDSVRLASRLYTLGQRVHGAGSIKTRLTATGVRAWRVK